MEHHGPALVRRLRFAVVASSDAERPLLPAPGRWSPAAVVGARRSVWARPVPLLVIAYIIA